MGTELCGTPFPAVCQGAVFFSIGAFFHPWHHTYSPMYFSTYSATLASSLIMSSGPCFMAAHLHNKLLPYCQSYPGLLQGNWNRMPQAQRSPLASFCPRAEISSSRTKSLFPFISNKLYFQSSYLLFWKRTIFLKPPWTVFNISSPWLENPKISRNMQLSKAQFLSLRCCKTCV